MDIKSFYPSIDPTRGAKIARCMWNRSKLEVPNLNVDELIEYVSKFGQNDSIVDENLKDFLYLKKKKKKSFVKRKRVAKKFKNKGFKAAQGLSTLAKPKKKENGRGGLNPKNTPTKLKLRNFLGLHWKS